VTDTDSIARALTEMTGGDLAGEQRALGGVSTLANPAPWLVDFYGGGTPSAGVRVTEATALSASAVFACVRNIAEDEAKLPFIVYRNLEPQGKERLKAHPLYRLLHDEPNPEMSSFDFRQAVTACAVLFGGGYAEIEKTQAGVPLYLWPIESWRVRPLRDAAKNLYYEVDGRDRLDPADMLHIRGFGFDGVLGCMLAQVGKESLGLTIAAQRFAASFFGNGTKVSGLLSHPKMLSPEAHKRLKESWTEEHGGPGNAHKPRILEEGMTWTQLSTAPDEAQMVETRQFQVEDVARWFRMPPHKIQHLLRSTFSNIEHQGSSTSRTPSCRGWFDGSRSPSESSSAAQSPTCSRNTSSTDCSAATR
jgi:HK97 family phage portal protein